MYSGIIRNCPLYFKASTSIPNVADIVDTLDGVEDQSTVFLMWYVDTVDGVEVQSIVF